MRRAAAAFLLESDRVLLARRAHSEALYPGVWDAVGGHAEEGESFEHALTREVHEELGITLKEFKEVAVLQEPLPLEYGEAQYRVFVATSWEGTPTNQSSEHSALEWVTLAQALALPLAHPRYSEILQMILGEPEIEANHGEP